MRFGDFETKIKFVTQVAAIHGAFPAPLRAHTARLISALRYIGVASLIITISLLAVRNTSTWLTERSKITVPPTDQIEARISNNESANQFLITGLLP